MKNSAKRSGAKIVVVFVALGPPIGGVAGGLILFLMDVLGRGYPNWGVLRLLPVIALMAYIPGVIPAALTGVSAVTVLKHVESDWEWIATVTAAGAVWSGLILMVLMPGALMPVVGAIASLVCSLASRRIRPLRNATRINAKDSTPETGG